MLNMNLKRIFTTLIIILLAGCATSKSEPELTANEKLAQYLNEGELITEETDRGLVVYLPSLFFETGSAELKSAAQDKIRYIGNAINEDYVAGRRIAIEGHTDSVGDEDFNLNLSKQRAESVSDELVFSQVATNRIETAWFGESSPIAPNENADGTANEEGRAKNRRVEFIILNPDS